MIPKGKSKQFLRVTVDTEAADAELLQELEDNGPFPSKREIFLAGLRLLSGLFRARRRGLRPQLVDPVTTEIVDFDWQSLPKSIPTTEARNITLARVKEAPIRRLLACAKEMRDPDLQRVAATIAQAAWDPSGLGTIDVQIIAELIVIAYGKSDETLLSATRDVLTEVVTASRSFEELLSQAVHNYRPSFDTRYFEQRFLSDQYDRLLRLRYPAEAERFAAS